MTKDLVTIDRVLELIAAYGALPAAWPEDERAAAIEILKADPDRFAAALDEAYALDTFLETEDIPEPSLALSDAILAHAPKAQAKQQSLLGVLGKLIFPQGARWPAGAALASLMMGLVSGYAYASTGVGYDQADAVYYAAFGGDFETDWLGAE